MKFMSLILKKNQKKKISLMIDSSHIIVLATPHKEFKKIKISKNKVLIDTSGFFLK